MEENMSNELTISEYYNAENKRAADLSKDEHHYVCRLSTINNQGVKVPWGTRLVYNKNVRYAEDLCENFTEGYGIFKDLSDFHVTMAKEPKETPECQE